MKKSIREFFGRSRHARDVEEHRNMFFESVYHNDVAAVSALLARYPELGEQGRNGPGAEGETGMEMASRLGHIAAAEVIFAATGRIGYITETESALCKALEAKKTDMALWLLDHGASTEAALRHFTKRGDVDAIRLLLDRGADVNSTNGDIRQGLTPLFFVKDKPTAALLLDHGANRAEREAYDHHTPAQYLRSRGDSDVADFIDAYEPRPVVGLSRAVKVSRPLRFRK